MNSTNPLFTPRDQTDVEAGCAFAPQFDEAGLIPAVAVDHRSGEVLMVAYMNAESLAKTVALGEAVYFSRSRRKLWHKGEESGHVQKVREILTDCDQDVVVLKVEQLGGGCCHTGYRSCFYRRLEGADGKLSFTQNEKAFDPRKVYKK